MSGNSLERRSAEALAMEQDEGLAQMGSAKAILDSEEAQAFLDSMPTPTPNESGFTRLEDGVFQDDAGQFFQMQKGQLSQIDMEEGEGEEKGLIAKARLQNLFSEEERTLARNVLSWGRSLPQNVTIGVANAMTEAVDAFWELDRSRSTWDPDEPVSIDDDVPDVVDSLVRGLDGTIRAMEWGGVGPAADTTQKLAQWALPFSVVMKGLKGVGLMREGARGLAARGLLAEMAAETTFMDPYEENLAGFVHSLGLDTEFVDYMAGGDSDSNIERRVKNGVANAGMPSVLVGSVMGGMQVTRIMRSEKFREGLRKALGTQGLDPNKRGVNGQSASED